MYNDRQDLDLDGIPHIMAEKTEGFGWESTYYDRQDSRIKNSL